MNEVISKDGTPIAYERLGAGPAVVIVDGALCSREFGPSRKLAELLAPHCTAYIYDRRGRGASGDAAAYAVAREVEDLEAVIAAAGGAAAVVGFSSGAALALEAAASGADIARLAVYEPPYMVDDGGYHARADHPGRLRALVAAGRRGAAVRYFMRDMVGIPAPFVWLMRAMLGMWRKLEAVAHTLAYDAMVMGGWQVPAARFAAVKTPTLAMNGGKTDRRLKRAVAELVKVLPEVRHRELAGQAHNVSLPVLAPVLVEFFTETAR